MVDLVELRPVFQDDPPPQWGIRSRKLRLIESEYLEAQSRRVMISPAALQRLLPSRDNLLLDKADRVIALKTWLGYRYDRPAVPNEYLPLLRFIAETVSRRAKEYSDKVRDILVQFEENEPPRYRLFAVVVDEGDTNAIVRWLAEATRSVPTELGIGDDFKVATAEGTSLAVIESSYAVDLTHITYGESLRGAPGRFSRP